MGMGPLFKKTGLRNKLALLFFTTVVVPLFIILNITITMLSDQIVKQTVQIHHESVKQIASNLNDLLLQYVDISNRYSYDDKLKTYLDVNRNYTNESEILDIYTEYLKPFQYYDKTTRPTSIDLKVYYLNSTLIQDYDTYIYADENVRKQKPFIDGFQGDGRLVWGLDGSKAFLSRMVKYYDEDNNYYIVALFIDTSRLYSLINFSAAAGATIIISDEDGNVVTSSDSGLQGKSIKQKGYYRHLMTMAESDFINDTGEPYKIISLPIKANSRSLPEWRVSALIPVDVMLADEEKIRKMVYILSLSCLVVSCFVFMLFIEKITHRMKVLIDKMKGINDKEFSIIPEDGNQDEMGMVTRIFNGMVKNLQTLIYENYEVHLKVKDIELKKREAELYALQSQIHPHFLFNTLESLRMDLVEKDDSGNATLVANLSNLLRKSLSWSGEIISIADEIQFARNYLEIQKFRFSDRLDYEIDIPERLLDCRIPKLTIQPLVENAVLHGAEPKWGHCRIGISVYAEDGSLFVKVSDDGIGIKEERLEEIRKNLTEGSEIKKGTSIGLNNINDRIRLNYGEGFGISITSSLQEGTSVTVKIPLRMELPPGGNLQCIRQ